MNAESASLSIRTLGGLEITLDGDDRETVRALSNLSVLLSSLRKHLPVWIQADHQKVLVSEIFVSIW